MSAMLTETNPTAACAAAARQLLVVDDEAEIGEVVKFVAEECGFEATLLDDALGFPSVYRRGFDTIVLDLSMPGADGVELLRFMAQDRCESRIVLMSGFDAQVLHAARELAKGYGLRIAGVLQKPLDLDALAGLLSQPAARAAARPAADALELSVEGLRHAIASGQVVPHFMPKVAMSSGAFLGVEALARWQHPERGLVAPMMFVPFAEANGLSPELTAAILERTLVQCARWRAEGMRLGVAVNVSARDLNVDFPDLLQSQALAHGVDPEQITIEVTETAVAQDLAQSLDVLTRLRMKKFGLSIDDFGTGYSSMQQLHRAPFTELKIDQSFVRNLPHEEQARNIVQSTIDLGRRLNMTLVAEGVEDAGIWQRLQRMGCDEGQGYYITKPIPGAEIAGWHARWQQASGARAALA